MQCVGGYATIVGVHEGWSLLVCSTYDVLVGCATSGVPYACERNGFIHGCHHDWVVCHRDDIAAVAAGDGVAITVGCGDGGRYGGY